MKVVAVTTGMGGGLSRNRAGLVVSSVATEFVVSEEQLHKLEADPYIRIIKPGAVDQETGAQETKKKK